jgi:hypothetical protein
MLLASLLLTCMVPSEAAPLPFADKYDQAFEEAVTRNVPVLIVDFDSWATNNSGGTIAAFYEDADFRKVAENAVLILASQGDHGTKKQVIDGVERPVCKEFGGTVCSNHLRMLTDLCRDAKVFGKVGVDGAIHTPLFAVVTPSHEVVGSFSHEQLAAVITNLLRTAQKQIGPGLARGDYLKLLHGLADARERADLADYATANDILDALARIPGNFKPNAAVKSFRDSLEPKGRELMTVAEQQWKNGQLLDALTQMDDVATGFGKLAVAHDAAARMASWEKVPEAKGQLPALKADREARQLYLHGVALVRAGESKKAAAELEKLVKSQPKSRFTERAQKLLDSLSPKK